MDSLVQLFSEKTFETSTALSAFYMWILFNYLSTMLNCDLQHALRTSPLAQHAVAIITLYFLFTVIDSKNDAGVGIVWAKTFVVYVLLVMLIKSKWYFAVPSIALLVVDQTIKIHVNRLEKHGHDTQDWQRARRIINVFNIALITAGFVHYVAFQAIDHRADFTFGKLFFMTSCRPDRQAPGSSQVGGSGAPLPQSGLRARR